MTEINRKGNSFNKMRGYAGMFMGVVYFFVAYLTIVAQQKGTIDIGDTLSYVLAALMTAYGIFRIYRGYRIVKENQ